MAMSAREKLAIGIHDPKDEEMQNAINERAAHRIVNVATRLEEERKTCWNCCHQSVCSIYKKIMAILSDYRVYVARNDEEWEEWYKFLGRKCIHYSRDYGPEDELIDSMEG